MHEPYVVKSKGVEKKPFIQLEGLGANRLLENSILVKIDMTDDRENVLVKNHVHIRYVKAVPTKYLFIEIIARVMLNECDYGIEFTYIKDGISNLVQLRRCVRHWH